MISPLFHQHQLLLFVCGTYIDIIFSFEKFNRMISGRLFTLVFISLCDTLLPPLGLNQINSLLRHDEDDDDEEEDFGEDDGEDGEDDEDDATLEPETDQSSAQT